MIPAPVREWGLLARSAGWAALCRYESPAWTLTLVPPDRGGRPARNRFEVEFRDRKGWRVTAATETVEWERGDVWRLDVAPRELRAVLTGAG